MAVDLCYLSLQEFSRKYMKETVRDKMMTKQKEILEKRLRNQSEQKKIQEESDAVIHSVEKRKEQLLLPFEREIDLLDEQQMQIDKILEAENVHEEMTHQLEDADCEAGKIKELQVKLEETNEDLEGILEGLKKKKRTPPCVDFERQKDRLSKVIASYGERVIERLSGEYENMEVILSLDGSEKGDKFLSPYGLSVCPTTDHVYLTTSNYNNNNNNNNSVDEYDQNGRFIREMKVDYILRGVAINSKGHIILPDLNRSMVWIYDENFKLIQSMNRNQNHPGEGLLRQPRDVACDEEDNIYLTCTHCHRVQVYKANGDFLRTIDKGNLYPCFMQITNNNRIVVTEYRRVSVFTLQGESLTTIQIARPTIKVDRPNRSGGTCMDSSNGYILVADNWNKQIQVFSPELEHHATIEDPCDIFQEMSDIAMTKSGNLFVTDWKNNKVHILQ